MKVWTDDGRRTDDGGLPYYKFPGAFGSGELKTLNVLHGDNM